MRIPNVVTIADWRFRRYFIFFVVIQMAFLGSIGWTAVGLDLPVLRQLIGAFYSLFLPGVVILRILRVHNLGSSRTILFCVGLSISTLMLVGLFANLFYPLISIEKPLSPISFELSLTSILAVLFVGSCIRDRGYSPDSSSWLTIKVSSTYLVMYFLLFLTVFGAFCINLWNNSAPMLLMLLLLAGLFGLVGATNRVPKELYPAVVLTSSVVLLLHTSLISKYLTGWDIQLEYFLANHVAESSIWDPSIPGTINGMLSVVILAPALAALCNVSLIEVFKVIYPVLFSLVPLAIFSLCKSKFKDDRVAVLAVLFFVSVFTFYNDLITLARQEIAEVFMVLLIILIVDPKLQSASRSILLIVFGFSLVVSHYALSYVFIIMLVLVWMLMLYGHSDLSLRRLVARLAFLCLAVALLWYSFVSQASSFLVAVEVFDNVSKAFVSDFLSPESAQGIAYITGHVSTSLQLITRYFHLFSQTMIVLGVLVVYSHRHRSRQSDSYFIFGVAGLVIMLAGIAAPFFASSIYVSRLYHIGLIVLSPYFVVGFLWLFGGFRRIGGLSSLIPTRVSAASRALSLFLALFLLVNAGFIAQFVGGENQRSMFLDSSNDSTSFNDREFYGASWIHDVSLSGDVYSDAYRWLLVGTFDWSRSFEFPSDLNETPQGVYIFFGTLNSLDSRALVVYRTGVVNHVGYVGTSSFTLPKDRLMDNGGATVYY